MSGERKRRVKTQQKEETVEMRLARLESKHNQLLQYIHDELGEEGEFQVQLNEFLCHITATCADLRDAAAIANSELHSGNMREAMSTFYTVVEAVCEIHGKRQLLNLMFPDLIATTNELLRNPDGTDR